MTANPAAPSDHGHCDGCCVPIWEYAEALKAELAELTKVNCAIRDELAFQKREELRLRREVYINFEAAQKAEAREKERGP